MSTASAQIDNLVEPPAGGAVRAAGVNLDVARRAVSVRTWLLTLLSFAAGVVDMIAFLGLGKVFTAFQTGNLVFLGLGIIGKGPKGVPLPNPVWVVASFVAFALGAMLSAKIVRPKDSEIYAWPQRVTTALVITVVTQAAFLIGWIAVAGKATGSAGAILLAIMAFGMGVQIHAIRSLRVPEVSTTAATATFVTFVSDIVTGSLRSRADFVRLYSMLAMIAGAAVGTLLIDNSRLYAPVLPLVITIIVAVIAVTLKGKPQEPSAE